MACSTNYRPNWFVAIPIDIGKSYAYTIASPLGEPRIFKSDDLHLTIAFLGAVGEDAALKLWHSLDLTSLASFFLELAKVETFGSSKKPSAYGVVPAIVDDQLKALFDYLAEMTWSVLGIKINGRVFRPHITFARPKRGASKEERKASEEWALARDYSRVPALKLKQLALYTWSDDRTENLFRIVHKTNLGVNVESL